MVYQNNKELLEPIQKSGCNLLSHLYIAQMENRRILSASGINTLYRKFQSNGWIDKECTVLDPNKILNYVSNKRILQVGSIIGGKTHYWYHVKRYDWIICKMKTDGVYGTHFIVSDEYGNSIYDPLLGEGYNPIEIEAFRLYQVA